MNTKVQVKIFCVWSNVYSFDAIKTLQNIQSTQRIYNASGLFETLKRKHI